MERKAPRVPPRAAAFALVSVVVAGGASGAAAATAAPSAALRAEPPPLTERVPPLPGQGAFTWLPGRWRWSGLAGVEWQWQPGRYVEWSIARRSGAVDRPQPVSNGVIGSDDER